MFLKAYQRLALIAASLIVMFALAGCSSVTVNYDYDKNVDFKKFKTYGWLEPQSGGSSPGMVTSGLVGGRIRNAIEAEMNQRGLTQSDPPDIQVIYHLGTEEKIQVTDWGYNYSNYYWGYGGRQVDVSQYTQGTLIVDVVDAETHNLIWRGSGTGVIDETNQTPEKLDKDIPEVIAKIMASFPPN